MVSYVKDVAVELSLKRSEAAAPSADPTASAAAGIAPGTSVNASLTYSPTAAGASNASRSRATVYQWLRCIPLSSWAITEQLREWRVVG